MAWGWFGVGLYWFALVLVGGTAVLSTDSARFGLGLVWPGVGLVILLCFPMTLLGLGMDWLVLARCGFCGTVVFSLASAWFGLGLAQFGLVCV